MRQAGNNSPIALNFRLTARDQNGDRRGTQFADTKLLLEKTAGPFLVNSQPTAARGPSASRSR